MKMQLIIDNHVFDIVEDFNNVYQLKHIGKVPWREEE